MAKRSDKLADFLPDDDASAGRTALVTGSVALGAYLTGALLRWARRSTLAPPERLPPALAADVEVLELMEGTSCYYAQEGSGTPVVLLHSFNVAASSFEMQPIFDHIRESSGRPIYALEWFGYGRSGRPPVAYRPELYLRQLRRFLSEVLQEPADVVALSLGAEYAALVAIDSPFLVRRLVAISPAALTRDPDSLLRRGLVGLAGGTGAFEFFFYRVTRRASLHRSYAEQVFRSEADVPEALVDYAYMTSHVRGAPFAPLRFIDGSLFLGERAYNAYSRLQVPTLFIVPETGRGTVQSFERLEEVLSANPEYLKLQRLPSGLLPQWDAPDALFDALDAFLDMVASPAN